MKTFSFEITRCHSWKIDERIYQGQTYKVTSVSLSIFRWWPFLRMYVFVWGL